MDGPSRARVLAEFILCNRTYDESVSNRSGHKGMECKRGGARRT